MTLFDANEIMRFAVRVEENGERFYRYAAMISDDEESRYLFNYLADEEIKHRVYFEGLLVKMEIPGRFAFREPQESYQGEYIDYMKNYLDRRVIFNQKSDVEFKGIRDTLSVLNFALDREVDSILYYTEIKVLVPKAQHQRVDQIIEEERKHFFKLSEVRKEIDPTLKT